MAPIMNEQAQVYDEQDMNESNVWAMDHRLWVQFYTRAVKNEFKTSEAGRPIFDEKPFVKIIVPGDKNMILDTPATMEHQHRFPKQWERYQNGQKQSMDGTPLEAVTWLTVGQVAELKALNIFSVEQLSDVPDQLAQRFMGAFELRRKAQAFIEASKGEAATSKLAHELEMRDAQIAQLQEQMAQLLGAQKAAQAPKAPTKAA
jgi:hypothetical protein